jgi:hypothetical protein
MKRYAAILFGAAATTGFLFTTSLVFAQTKISLSLPGSYLVTTSTPPGYVIANLYQFALLLGGLLAFGAIIYGGMRYISSGGNPSAQSEAKEWIWSAMLGLLLLVSAYLILYTINPNLVQLGLPTLQQISIVAPAQTSGGQPIAGATGCASGQCDTLPNCTPGPNVNCGGAPEMAATLQCVQSKDSNFTVSEGYPPRGTHESQCHNNGCCVDTVVSGNDCAAVNSLIQAAQQCGASVANEYTSCNGTAYKNTTGGNVHINSPHINGC